MLLTPLSSLLGSARQWHWISSAIFMGGLLLFAITGITLNHAEWLEGEQTLSVHRAKVPAPLLQQLVDAQSNDDEQLPDDVVNWLELHLPVRLQGSRLEWDDDEVVLDRPSPGRETSLSVKLESGLAQLEVIDHGWIAFFNDLHKGRHTGQAWTLFTDAFAIACIVFGITGFMLLQRHAGARPMTWPLLGLGLLIPLLLILLFIH